MAAPDVWEAATDASGPASVPSVGPDRRYSVPVTTEPPAGGEDVDALHHEVESLQHQNDELRHEVEATKADKKAGRKAGKRTRLRTISSWVLVVVACLLAVLSVVVIYARNQLLNTDTFVATVAPLAKDHAIQTAVATKVSENLVARTNIEQRVKDALPARAGFLADPISSAVQTATYQITLKLVQSSQFQTLWEQALRKSHDQLDNVLLGKKVGAFQTTDGKVTVDLSQVEDAAKRQLSSHGLSIFNKVPDYTGGPFVLFQSDQLAKLQRWVRFLNNLSLVLPIVSVLLFALAVVLARDRRKGLVHATAGLAVSMAILLVGVNIGRGQYLGSLGPHRSKDAAAAVIDTVDASLLDSIRVVLIVATVIAVVAFVLGLGPVRRWMEHRGVPSWLSGGPVHDTVAGHRRLIQWVVAIVGLVVLVLWNQPTVLVALVIVLVTLAVVALVGVYAGNRGGVGPGGGDPGQGTPGGGTPPPATGSGTDAVPAGSPTAG